jgi:hypothetical protein
MSKALCNRRVLRMLATAALIVTAASWRVEAGGPLFVINGVPILWANRVVRGGPLNSTTVAIDAQGRRNVIYHVDQGTLGPMSNAQAVHFADRIFGEFSNIPTSAIKFVNGGPIRDPDTGQPADVTADNIGKFLDDEHPTFQNPIIFDSDGAITGSGGVLGFFGVLAVEPDVSAITESFVVLNGAVITPPNAVLSTTSFLGVFQHEFGHFAGPLDHEQINGSIALFLADAAVPAGFTNRGQTFDLFVPFLETTYPFFFRAPATGSQLRAAGLPDTGFFIATLDMDTKNALSNLYPTGVYRDTTGSIEGQVFFRTNGGGRVPVSGINVVARRIDRAPYPPPLGTQAFPTPPTLDADGVPSVPPPQAATDSLATVSSAVTGLDFGRGTYRIQGLPPGDYEVMLQEILPQAVGGSRIGPTTFQLTLPVIEEYFRKGGTSNVVSAFTPVRVEAGKLTRGVDLEINGLDTGDPEAVEESASHLTLATAQDLGTLPARIVGTASPEDPFGLVVQFGATACNAGGNCEGIQDLYKFQTTRPVTIVWMSLEPKDQGISTVGDLDLFLFRSTADPTTPVRAGSNANPRFSATGTSHELIGVALGPGTWFLGVGAFDGSVRYQLRVIQNVQ